MSGKIWSAQAPSNIALIKYMGKVDSDRNRPTNTSLSYTLSHLKSRVELERCESGPDRWEPLQEGLKLSSEGARRFLAHLDRLKREFSVESNFIVRSANDFPSDCGLASSASSFAALTMAAVQALTEISQRAPMPQAQAADWSRQGSGSSCRSFFSPWAIWDQDGVRPIDDIGFADLVHQVVVVDDEKKLVSSSEAHKRVTSSLLFQGRPERAEARARDLTSALRARDWQNAFEITWAEFWDMHALFETSRPSFAYINPRSIEVLRWVRRASWEKHQDGPLITMDAGPNIHLLHRNDDFGRGFARTVEAEFSGRYRVYSGGGVS